MIDCEARLYLGNNKFKTINKSFANETIAKAWVMKMDENRRLVYAGYAAFAVGHGGWNFDGLAKLETIK